MNARGDIEYNGKWHFPEFDIFKQHNLFQDCMGTLYHYKDENPILEVYHQPDKAFISNRYCCFNTVWGNDANGNFFTLFNVNMIKQESLSKTIFSVGYCLVGENVESIDTPIFNTCSVRFPYLRNWAFKRSRDIKCNDGCIVTNLNIKVGAPIVKVDLENGITLSIKSINNHHNTLYETIIKEDSILTNKSIEPISIRMFLKHIYIFKQFLSIALYGEQHPCNINFEINSKEEKISTKLLYKVEESHTPYIIPLLKFENISYKVTDVLKKWYCNYEQMSPICDNLIQSTHRGVFDTPNFLIIAHALDGYHKRFVNKKDGKDVRQYQQQIEILLEHFKDIRQLQECKLDAEILAQSRHKYSHLIPDDDEKIQKAVSGSALFRLTRKAMILLTCCILENLGLTTDEINNCLDESVIARFVNTISIYED